MVCGVNNDRHDHNIWRVWIMPDEFLERLVRHFDLIRTTAVYEANQGSVDLKHEKAFGIHPDPFRDFFVGCGFAPFVGGYFDLKAAINVGRAGGSKIMHVPTLTRPLPDR